MNIHIVSHTHWDREWYRSFNYFNIKLSYLFDSLFEILDSNKDYKHFMLDGQMVMIEDYLAMRPEHRGKLKKYVQEKRIIIGPWYTQPDEFAPDAESLTRNLLIGINQAKEFGDFMKVGYLPDSFGHTAQLPQLLKGFNIKTACIMRGVPTHLLKQPEFKWKSINDDEVLVVSLPSGYSNGMFLPTSIPQTDIRIKKTISEMIAYGSKDNFLIMEGVDHQLPNEEIVAYINSKNSSNDTYLHSSLEDYIEGVSLDNLQTLNGELITPATNRVHTSMASTRMPQKTKNRRLETLLEYHVEPYLTLSWLHGASYPKQLLNNAWKLLLKNQTHDSICGCCTDLVHQEMDQRFTDIKTIGETLHKVNSRAFSNLLSKDQRTLTVFNDSLVKGTQIITAEVFTDSEHFILKDDQGNTVDYVIEKVEKVDTAKLSIWSLYMDTPCITYKQTINFEINFTFNFGYKVLTITEEVKPKNIISNVKNTSNIIENKYSIVTINPNGSFNLYDKETHKTYLELNTFEDRGDAGDTYNFSPVEEESTYTTKSIIKSDVEINSNFIKTTATITFTLQVPKDLTKDGKKRSLDTTNISFTTEICVYNNLKRIDVKTTLTNTALNHRIRVLFPTTIVSKKSYAEIQYGILERPNTIIDADKWVKLGFKEQPLPIYSMQRFVSIKDNKNVLSILNKGLTEYEIYDNNTIAITLLRSVGYMGKANLSVRPGRPSGVPIPTPNAQCQGTHEFLYSILFNSAIVSASEITNEAIKYSVHSNAVQNELPLTNLQNKLSSTLDLFHIRTLQTAIKDKLVDVITKQYLLTLSANELVISAIKKSENEEALILRLYNPSNDIVKSENVKISFTIDRVFKCNFLEENQNEIITQNNSFKTGNISKFTAQTYKIYINK